jgi:hypothetical protein
MRINGTLEAPPATELLLDNQGVILSTIYLDAYKWTPLYPQDNTRTWQIWSISEAIVANWSSYSPWNDSASAIALFPFEHFILTFFIMTISDFQPQLSTTLLLQGFTIAQSNAYNVGYFDQNYTNLPDELIGTTWNFQSATVSEIQIDVSHPTDYVLIMMAMYLALGLFAAILVRLVKSRNIDEVAQHLTENSLTILLFLPLFLFAFRPFAPSWLVPVDIGVIVLILLYGMLALLSLNRRSGNRHGHEIHNRQHRTK